MARSGFVVAGIGLLVSVFSATSQAGATAASPVAAPAAVAPSSDSDDDGAPAIASWGDSDDHGRADQSDTHCPGTRRACGINGHYVCCDFETECCRRKNRRTVCSPKSDKACPSTKPTPPVPVPVPG